MSYIYFHGDVTAAITQVGAAAASVASAALIAANAYAKSVERQETVVNVNVNLEGAVADYAVEERVRLAVAAALKHAKRVQDMTSA